MEIRLFFKTIWYVKHVLYIEVYLFIYFLLLFFFYNELLPIFALCFDAKDNLNICHSLFPHV